MLPLALIVTAGWIVVGLRIMRADQEQQRQMVRPYAKFIPRLQPVDLGNAPPEFLGVLAIVVLAGAAIGGLIAYYERNRETRRDLADVNRVLAQVRNGAAIVVVFDQDSQMFRIVQLHHHQQQHYQQYQPTQPRQRRQPNVIPRELPHP